MKFLLPFIIFLTGCVSPLFPTTTYGKRDLTVQVSEMTPEQQLVMEYAVSQWNEKLNYNQFTIVISGKANIYASTKELGEKYGGIFYPANLLNSARIMLNADLSGCAVEIAAMHELGHAIGLEHSKDINDVMYYSTEGGCKELSYNDITLAKEKLNL